MTDDYNILTNTLLLGLIMDYTIYVVDTETTGLDSRTHDVIEVSMYRLSDDSHKTWFIAPLTPETAETGALRVNGHKIEDLKLATKHGRDTYKNAADVLIEIENWVAEDNCSAENRILCGQNIPFDKDMLQQLWIKCKAKDSYPFGRRILDTMQIEFFLDWCSGSMADSYSLSSLAKKYGVKNEKAHSSEADVKATREVFLKQVDFFKKCIKNT